MNALILTLLLPLQPAPAQPAPAPDITLTTLLTEMSDRSTLARFPSPSYTCRQFSSYDPASTSPDNLDTWFANGDRGHYLRIEEREGRKEHVLMDADGPGAVVRIWSANPAGNLRFYLDHSEEPALTAPMTELLGGTGLVAPPLSAERSKGWNLYLPIPYATHCKITSDAGDFYYQVNYRTFEPGTAVESFTLDALEAAASQLAALQQELLAAGKEEKIDTSSALLINPGATRRIKLGGGGALQSLTIHLEAEDLRQALRTTVLSLAFDGEETVWCPVGDFFGTGVGPSPLSDWFRTVNEDGTMTCRWIMPYRDSVEVRLENLGSTRIRAKILLGQLPGFTWDDSSMYFHATWRQENPIHNRPMVDWNYVDIEGRGVYVGDNLHVANPVKGWWGEGDEKIWVDGEEFPSHFGTGTEDYYGYAWCSPEPFQAPFHNQPRCDGPNNYGHTLISRLRALDGIPFQASLKFDMEVWHWVECDEGYAATTYFYALPGAKTNRPPAPEEAARGILDPPPLPPPFRIEGGLECEDLEILAHTPDISIGPQGGHGDSLWSGSTQLWVQGKQVGDFVELKIPVEGDGPVGVKIWATRSWDYGIVLFSINGESTGLGADLFNVAERQVVNTGALELGVHTPKDGALTLRCEVVGGNPLSEGSRSFFGLDCVLITPAGE